MITRIRYEIQLKFSFFSWHPITVVMADYYYYHPSKETTFWWRKMKKVFSENNSKYNYVRGAYEGKKSFSFLWHRLTERNYERCFCWLCGMENYLLAQKNMTSTWKVFERNDKKGKKYGLWNERIFRIFTTTKSCISFSGAE